MSDASESQRQRLSQSELTFEKVTTSRDAASLFIHNLLEAAGRVIPDREWSPEDLFAVLTFALEGGDAPAGLFDGRAFERRLEEAIERGTRYGENFSVMVVYLAESNLPSELHASVLDGLIERLRKSDQVFLFQGKAAIILPYTSGKDLTNLIGRVRGLIEAVLNSAIDIRIEQVAFPSDISTAPALWSWAKEHLQGLDFAES